MATEMYDELRDRIRTAIFAGMSSPSEFDDVNVIESQLMEEAFEIVDEVMPDPAHLEAGWVIGMLEARPKLLEEGLETQRTVAEAVIWAVGNHILADLEPDIFEHAREKGFELPAVPAP